ncbi:MAG: L-threonylcarbamoyladenylate synthase [Pseudomonadota bacterium]
MADLNTVLLSDTSRGIRAATSMLHAGAQVAFPTETVYGLGADARNDRAVAGIFEAKRRPSFNPLIVHVTDLDAAHTLARFTPQAQNLAERFWPGPLTLVLPLRPGAGLSDLVTAGLPTIGIRVPAHPVAQSLIGGFGGPVAAPSANLSGKVSPTTAEHVFDGLRGRIAVVVDGGPCAVGLESTILGFSADDPVLLRPGGISLEILSQRLGREIAYADDTTITAPGQMRSHYAPSAEIRLNAEAPEDGEIWLGFGPDRGIVAEGRNLSPSGDLTEAAANLFSALRDLDALAWSSGLRRIAVAKIPAHGLGEAINDRLQRAAAPRNEDET